MKNINDFLKGFFQNEYYQKWVTYFYPKVKTFLKKYISKSYFTVVETVYEKMDEHYNSGIPIENVTEVPKEQAQKAKDAMEAEVDSVTVYGLPKLHSIFEKLGIFKSVSQERIGTCAIWTFNNMIVWFMLKSGLKPQKDLTNVTLMYKDLKYRAGDSGTVVSVALRKLAKKGVPVKTVETILHRKYLSELEKNEVVGKGWDYTFPFFKDKDWIQAKNFEDAVKLDRELGDNYVIQVSFTFSKALRYFGNIKPFLDFKQSFKRTGGHSVAGVRGSFSIDKDGDNGMVIIDSAYRSSEEGWRFITELMVNSGVARIRFVEVDTEVIFENIEKPKPTVKPKENQEVLDKSILSTTIIKYGDKGEAVRALQRYLDVNVDGDFGEVTRTALMNWQFKQYGKWYSGKYWKSSRNVYKKLMGIK